MPAKPAPATSASVSPCLPGLHTLGLAYNDIDEVGMEALAKVLPRATPALTTLMLEGNRLGCEGVAALVACALLGDCKYGLKEDGEEEDGQIHGIGGGAEEEGGRGGGGGEGGDDKEGSNAALKMLAPPPVLLHLKKLTLGRNGFEGAGAYVVADYINVLVAWAMYADLPQVAIDLSFNQIGDDGLVEMARACFPGYKDADVEEVLLARRGPREPTPAAERSDINLSHNPITQQGPPGDARTPRQGSA